MKNKTTKILLTIALLGLPALSGARELNKSLVDVGFSHPGILHTDADFVRIKRQIAENNPQVKAAYDILKKAEFSQSSVVSTPTETIVRGGGTGENYLTAARAATMAYQNALRWKLDGTVANANKAIEILNAWAATTTEITGDSNYALASGLYGYEFANAAELMRDYEGWSRSDFQAFQKWMLDLWYPSCLGFLTQRNGTWENGSFASNGQCPGHYWSNWGLCNALTLMSIGILCDDVYIYNQGVSFYKYDQVGNFNVAYPNGYLTNRGCNEFLGNLVPELFEDARGPLGKLGQMQESGRDQGHALLAIGLATDICQVAWNQGDDLFGYMDNRLVAGIEYVAAYNFGEDDIELPFTEYHYANCRQSWAKADVQTGISEDGRGGIRPYWARIIGHYEGIKGLKLNYSEMALSQMGIDGGGKGAVSGGYDHLGYSVLTSTQNVTLASSQNVPTSLIPSIVYKGQEIQKCELGGTTNNYSSQEPEIEAGQTITLKVALPDGETNTGLWLWDNGETGQNLTFTVHHACVRKVEYTNANGVKSYQMFTIASLDDGTRESNGVNYTFSSGQIPVGCSNSAGDATVINGNLHVEMTIQANGKYRSDIKFNGDAGIALNPTADKYLAIKFNGTCPDGSVKMEFNDGSKWFNHGKYDSPTKFEDSNGNKIFYFDLTSNSNYTGEEPIKVANTLNIIIADNVRMQNYSVDWIKTFATEDDIKAYKDAKDDGADDYAIWNETTGVGYDNFITAVETAASAALPQVLTVRQNVCLNNARANITTANADVTIQGSDPRITIARKNWDNTNIFLLAKASGVKMTIKDLCFDGQGTNISNKFIEGQQGSEAYYENVTFRNHDCAKGSCAILAKFKTTVKDCKFFNLPNSTTGAIFLGVGGHDQLILEGNNEFDNASVNLYIENAYRFVVKNATHTTPITISLKESSWNDLSSKHLLFLNKNEANSNAWLPANISNFVILNDGICLTRGAESGHYYECHLAEGYAANISDLGYATFFGDDQRNLTIPEGVEAYACEVDNAKENVYLNPIESIIPSGTAVLLYSETPLLYQLVKTDLTPLTVISDNSLYGSSSAVELNGADADYYLLTKHEGAAAFKHLGDNSTVTSAAHKAYISLPKSTSVFRAPALRIGGVKDATKVSTIVNDMDDNGQMYNVSGQKVGEDYKGVVIRGGKKYMQK